MPFRKWNYKGIIFYRRMVERHNVKLKKLKELVKNKATRNHHKSLDTMKDRHTTLYINDISPVDFCGKTIAWQMDLDGAYEKPFETKATIGEHDYNTCEGCQDVLKVLVKRLTEKFEGNGKKKAFPLCCKHHANLNNLGEFDRASFVSVPEMVTKKIIYTNQHIINHQNSENYYKDITDYIDYTVQSFGQMPAKCGEPLFLSDYFNYVVNLLNNNEDISKDKKDNILTFLNAHQTPSNNLKTDLNILLATYQKWLKIFPFDVSYFAKLKPHYEKHLPILNGQPEVNKYLGTAKAKVHTRQSLINVLLNLTNRLLTDINSHSLYEKGLLTEPQKIKLELVLNERKLKLKQGYVNKSKDEEKQYRKILKEWFADEKKFIDEVMPLLSSVPPQSELEETSRKKGVGSKQPTPNMNTEHQTIVRIIPNITDYGNAMRNNSFKELMMPNLDKNESSNLYYANKVIGWYEIRKYEIIKNSLFTDRVDWLTWFLKYCKGLLNYTIQISKYAHLHFYSNDPKHKGKFDGEYLKFFRFLNSFDTYVISLKLNRDGNIGLALKMQSYCIDRIDELIGKLEKELCIVTRSNPIVIHFEEVKSKIENCIDFEKERFIDQNLPQRSTKENIDRLEVFKKIDIENSNEPSSLEQKEEVGKASVANDLGNIVSNIDKWFNSIVLISNYDKTEYHVSFDFKLDITSEFDKLNSCLNSHFLGLNSKDKIDTNINFIEVFLFQKNEVLDSRLSILGDYINVKMGWDYENYRLVVFTDFDGIQEKTNQEVAEFLRILTEISGHLVQLRTNFDEIKRRLNPHEKEKAENETQVEYDANHFNRKGFDLYQYLIENYDNNKKVKHINVFYFLREHNPNRTTYRFDFTIEKYKAYVLKNHSIELKTFKKASFKYDDTEVPKLKDLTRNYG
ncbi:MAG: hypothetical protein WBG90_18325 [Saonia sp.]